MALLLALLVVGKAQTPLFSEGFEDGIPDEWYNLDKDGDGFIWRTDDGFSSHGGDLGAISESFTHTNEVGALTPDNWLITPEIAIPAAGVYSLTFWVCAQDASWAAEHYGVYVTTGAPNTEVSNYTLMMEETINAQGGDRASGAWKQKRVSLQAFAGQTIHIAFRHFGVTDQFAIVLDDVNVELFTTDPIVTTNTNTVQFAANTVGNNFGIKRFVVSGANLTENVTVNLPTGTPFSIASATDSVPVNTLTFTPTSGAISKAVLVFFNPTAVNYYEANVTITSQAGTDTVVLKGLAVDCSQNQTIPWYEDFSTATTDTTFPPVCWSRISTDTADYVGSNGTVYHGRKYYTWCSTGSAYATVIGDEDHVQDEHLLTPTFDLRNIEGALDFTFGFITHPSYDGFVNGQVDLKLNMSTDGGNTYTTVWNARNDLDRLTEIFTDWSSVMPVSINLDTLKVNNVKFDFVYEGEAGVAGQILVYYAQFDNYFNPDMIVNAADSIGFYTYIGRPKAISIPVAGRNLNASINASVGAPFEISVDNGRTYSTTAVLPATGGNVLLRFNPSTPMDTSSTLTISSVYTDATHTYPDSTYNFNIKLTGSSYDCSGIVLPIAESFESEPGTVSAPNATEYCWQALKGNTSDPQNAIINSDDYAYTGTRSFRFSSVNYNTQQVYDQYLITPELSANNPMLVMFNYANASAQKDETFRVGYSTTGDNISDFVWENDIVNEANTDWQLYRNANVPADVKFIAVQYRSNRQYYLYIDNFQIMEAPSCLFPVSVKAVNTGENFADITWEEGDDETSWEMAYSVAPLDLDNATPVATGMGTTLNGLTANTHYQIAVRALCNEGHSDWSEIADFWTTTAPAIAPYTQTFDDDDADRNNWVLVNGNEFNHFAYGEVPGSGTSKTLMITQNDTLHTYILGSVTDSNNNVHSYTHYSTVWAYRDIFFPDTTIPAFMMSMKWRCNGEVDYDFGELFIGNATEVTNFNRNEHTPGYVDVNTMHYTPAGLTKLARFVNKGSFQSVAYLLPASDIAGKVQRVYFLWTNDSLSGTDYPLSIDNFKIEIPTFANMSGSVVDANTQAPIPNATITMVSNQGFSVSTTTDENGNYTFTDIVATYYNITINASGYNPYTDSWTLIAGDNNLQPFEMIIEECTIIPTGVHYTIEDDNLILTWDAHEDCTISQVTSYGSLGLWGIQSANSSFRWGCFHVFTPADLVKVKGSRITSIRTRVYGEPEYCDYKIAIYVGGVAGNNEPEPGALVYEQNINPEQVQVGPWMEIPLDNPYVIDGTQLLWIGYQGSVENTPSDGLYPIIHSSTCNKHGYSDVFLWYDSWSTENSDMIIEAKTIAPDLSYNVLAGSIELAHGLEENTYTVNPYIPGTCYRVTTICENGEVSVTSDCATEAVGIDNVDNATTFEVYPNPAHETVTVSSNMNAYQAEVLNYLGQVIYTQSVSSDTFTLNVANYADGVYFIRLTSNDGIATQKLIKR